MKTIKFHDEYNIDITKVLNATLNDITMKSVAKVGSNSVSITFANESVKLYSE